MAPAPADEPLGALLRRLREARGLGPLDAARASGVSRSALYQWETDLRVPRGAALERLLDALEAPERLRAELVARADPRHARLALARRPLGAPVALGGVLRAMRGRRGMTQAEAARSGGVSQAAFARWEGGGDLPDAATLHAVAFALGAAPEEAAALSLAGGGAGDVPATPEESVVASIVAFRTQEALHEVVQLGLEADAWRRSMRDPRWDVAVTSAMAKRASRHFIEGRREEAEAVAREAIRRARRPEARSEAVMALDSLEAITRRRGDPPGPMVRLAEAWAASIPVGPTPEGGSKAWAAKVAGRARAAAGDLEGALRTAADIPEWLAREYSGDDLDYAASFELAAVLIAGGAPERALDLMQPERGFREMAFNANVLIANAEPVPDALLRRFRALLPTLNVERRLMVAAIERLADARSRTPVAPYFH